MKINKDVVDTVGVETKEEEKTKEGSKLFNPVLSFSVDSADCKNGGHKIQIFDFCIFHYYLFCFVEWLWWSQKIYARLGKPGFETTARGTK